MTSSRDGLGSWLEGTPPDASPGERDGVRPAGLGRRLAALAVDWGLSLAVSAAFFPAAEPAVTPLLRGDSRATLAVFAVSTTVLVSLLGHTVGHRLLGLRVVPERALEAGATGRTAPPPGVLAGLTRTALLCLVIPAVVWDRRGRGLHDVAARTVLARR